MLTSHNFCTRIKHRSPLFSRNAIRPSRFARLLFLAVGLGIFAFTNSPSMEAADVPVEVGAGPSGINFNPKIVNINAGDTVVWTWIGSMSHSVTEGTPDHPTGFDSGIHSAGFTFSQTFTDPGTVDYYCIPHGVLMLGTINVAGGTPTATPTPTPTATPTPSPTPTPTPPAQSLNVSTRLDVGTGDKVSIGGIIITPGTAKRVLLRAIGPSLANFGITDPLADPVLELHAQDGMLITSNDNWKSDPQQMMDIEATGLAPGNDLESAIVTTLDPGLYTAVVTGKNGGTGVGLVEAYDLDQSVSSQLGNLSTRGFVDIGNNVMIGGFILGPDGNLDANVLVRAIGPSLTNFGVTDALADPVLELHDANGTVLMSDDNWKDNNQQAAIEATGLQPTNDLESAILMTLPPGGYTAVVSGKGGLTGVALVEVYRLP